MNKCELMKELTRVEDQLYRAESKIESLTEELENAKCPKALKVDADLPTLRRGRAVPVESCGCLTTAACNCNSERIRGLDCLFVAWVRHIALSKDLSFVECLSRLTYCLSRLTLDSYIGDFDFGLDIRVFKREPVYTWVRKTVIQDQLEDSEYLDACKSKIGLLILDPLYKFNKALKKKDVIELYIHYAAFRKLKTEYSDEGEIVT